jgi:hypothetical protein
MDINEEPLRLQRMTADRSDMSRARTAGERAAALARTPQEQCRAAELLVLVEHESGRHAAELRHARTLVALQPQQPRAWMVLRCAARRHHVSGDPPGRGSPLPRLRESNGAGLSLLPPLRLAPHRALPCVRSTHPLRLALLSLLRSAAPRRAASRRRDRARISRAWQTSRGGDRKGTLMSRPSMRAGPHGCVPRGAPDRSASGDERAQGMPIVSVDCAGREGGDEATVQCAAQSKTERQRMGDTLCCVPDSA